MRLTGLLGLSVIALFAAAAPALAQATDVMQYADTNSDGKVTPEEYTAFLGQAWDYLLQGAEKVKAADADPAAKPLLSNVTPDADGMVTKQALVAAASAKFKDADKNGDGVLDSAELNGSMQAK